MIEERLPFGAAVLLGCLYSTAFFWLPLALLIWWIL